MYMLCVYIYIYIYIYTYVYTVKSGGMVEVGLFEPKDIDEVSNRIPPVSHHRWNRNPRPQPHKFNKLSVFNEFQLSGSLVGVGGFDFIGNNSNSKDSNDSNTMTIDVDSMSADVIITMSFYLRHML